jgi:signal transduction histidine kinase
VDELSQNAFRFSNPGTPIQITLFPSSSELTLTLNDHGRGLQTEQLRKVGAYMQFDRSKNEQQGLGLGLIISKRLTELHGGTLTIQSEPGVGTTVVVKIPLAPTV